MPAYDPSKYKTPPIPRVFSSQILVRSSSCLCLWLIGLGLSQALGGAEADRGRRKHRVQRHHRRRPEALPDPEEGGGQHEDQVRRQPLYGPLSLARQCSHLRLGRTALGQMRRMNLSLGVLFRQR